MQRKWEVASYSPYLEIRDSLDATCGQQVHTNIYTPWNDGSGQWPLGWPFSSTSRWCSTFMIASGSVPTNSTIKYLKRGGRLYPRNPAWVSMTPRHAFAGETTSILQLLKKRPTRFYDLLLNSLWAGGDRLGRDSMFLEKTTLCEEPTSYTNQLSDAQTVWPEVCGDAETWHWRLKDCRWGRTSKVPPSQTPKALSDMKGQKLDKSHKHIYIYI